MFNSISSKTLRYKIKQTSFCRLEVLFSINHTRLTLKQKKIASQQKRESRTKGTKKPTKKGFKLTQSTMQVLIGEIFDTEHNTRTNTYNNEVCWAEQPIDMMKRRGAQCLQPQNQKFLRKTSSSKLSFHPHIQSREGAEAAAQLSNR